MRGVLTDEEIHELAGQIAAVDCVLEHGGVLVMRPLIAHASSKSQCEAPRRVLHIEYARPDSLPEGLKFAIA
jgi:hypothetical protein